MLPRRWHFNNHPSQHSTAKQHPPRPPHHAPAVARVAPPCPAHTPVLVDTPLQGGPDSDFEYSTQSYTGYEPTSMRAIRARYNPYVQARSRVDQLRRLGHSVDKVGGLLVGWAVGWLGEW